MNKRISLVFALSLAVPSVAAAERTLLLDEALEIAERSNLALVSAKTQVDASAEAVGIARAALLPGVQAQGKYTHNYEEVSFNGANGPVTIQPSEQFDGSVQVTLPLLSPSAYPGLSAAKRSLDASRADAQVSRANILVGVAQGFFAAAGTDELVVARTHAVEVAQATLKNAQARGAVGAVTEVEIGRAELAVVRAEQALLEANLARDKAYRALATALQLREPFKVAQAQADAAPAPAEGLKRPEIVSLEKQVDAFGAQQNAAGWRWAPTLSAFGNGRVFNYAGFSGDRYAWAAGLQLDWALFDGGLRDAQRRQAAARKRDAEARLKLIGDTLSDELKNAREERATREAALAAATRGANLSKRTLDLVRIQYDNGAATQLDLLEAQDALVTSEVAVAQARFDLSLADITLKRALGAFPARR